MKFLPQRGSVANECGSVANEYGSVAATLLIRSTLQSTVDLVTLSSVANIV